MGMAGFEPAASRLSAGCSSQAKLHALEQTCEKHTHFEDAHLGLLLVIGNQPAIKPDGHLQNGYASRKFAQGRVA